MHKKKSMGEKISNAFIQGYFFRRTGMFLVKKWRLLWKNIDFAIAQLARKVVMGRIKINPKKIIFYAFQGDYTCNPKYITEELLRENIDCEIVWAVRRATFNVRSKYSDKITFVEQYTPDYYREMASAKIWVVNSVEHFKRKFYKKTGQYVIETWHGALGIKRFDAEVNAGRAWVKAAKYCGKITDYCVSNSDFEDNVFRDTFWGTSEIVKFGHPRNDVLLREDLSRVAQERVRNYLLKSEKIASQELTDPNYHFVLYAPTFRDNHKFDAYDLDYEAVCGALAKCFGGEWRVLLRFHPTVRKLAGAKLNNKYCLNVTSYDDIQELMTVADVAITDYSSWIYDFVLTKKPGFLFTRDLEDYYTERGFYYPLTETPFPVCETNEELLLAIEIFDQNQYFQRVEEFLISKGCIEDGHASERTACLIQELLDKK